MCVLAQKGQGYYYAFMIIDTHTHIFNEENYRNYFTKAGDKVTRVLSLYYWSTFNTEGNIIKFDFQDLLAFAETKNNLSVVGSVDIMKDKGVQLQNLESLLKKEKIVAIKLYPGYQYFYPSDEMIYPIAELCQKYNKPLIFHSGDVYDFEGKAILKYSHPIHIDELATMFPQCKIIIAHFGFPYHLETANVVSKNTNVFTEISGTLVKLDSQQETDAALSQYIKDLQRVFAYFPDVKRKIMFGTDYSGEDTMLNQFSPYVKLTEAVFSKEEQKSVFYELAESIF